jgi:hypothetical protein
MKIIDIQVDNVDTKDYPDFVDAYVTYAVWADTGKELTEDELDQLNDSNPEIAQEHAMENLI